MPNPVSNTPEQYIAERLQTCRAAYVARDVETYMSGFAKDLRYHQADGRTIDFEQLARDVRAQLRRITAVRLSQYLESSERLADRVIQTYKTQAFLADSAFGFVHRIWRLERESQFTWRESEGDWQITEVTVRREQVVGSGFQIGLKPRLPALG